MRRLFVGSVATAVMLSLVALSVPSTAAAESNPCGGVAVKAPGANETILTITKGKVVIKLSMKKLQAMKSSNLTINEPFVKKKQSFRAIKLSSLFRLAGIKGADKVETYALNDYLYTNTAANFISADGYLAIARSGKPIGYDEGGPIRIIFPNTSKWTNFEDPWNWSIKSMKVS